MDADHYAVLGVPASAGPEEIKAAYKRKALALHPDKNPHGEAAFKRLQAAYQVLGDRAERARYDCERADRGLFAQAGAPRTPEHRYHRSPGDRHFSFARPTQPSSPPPPPPLDVDELIRKDKAAMANRKSLQQLLREAEQQRREAEELRTQRSEQGQRQAQAIHRLQQKFRDLNIEGAEWRREYGQFTPEEEAERRQHVAQFLMSTADDTIDDLELYRCYLSVSQMIVDRRRY